MSPVGVPEALNARAQGVADAFGTHTGVRVDAAALLTGRAALLGLTANGQISAGGATRILRAGDTWCAVTLSRPDDIAVVPALIETDDVGADPWPPLQRWVSTRSATVAVARARLLDLPAAVLGETAPGPPVTRAHGPRGERPGRLLVVDMSSMWAGPLCGRLLGGAGATVIKVESPRRPDGTRAGSDAFYDWMNRGKLSYAVEFDDEPAMRRLLEAADVVIEGSRPAALTRRGLGPADIAPRAGRIWLRISGYGSEGDAGTRVAFGDDAAVAGGLVRSGPDGPVFVGDAIADPLTGLHAAAAVAESLARGGGELIQMSMSATAAGYAGFVGGPVREPTEPETGASASALGADNAAVHALLDERHSRVMLIQRAALLDGRVVDIRVGAQITEMAPRLTPNPDDRVLDAAGGAVIPGLHDHHVHVHSAAAATDSVRVGTAEVSDRDGLARVLAGAEPGEDGWIRAVGYHEAVAGPLDRDRLDTLAPPVPVRIQHRSGILWTLNSKGLAAVGLADHPDGRLRSADRTWSDALQRRDTAIDDLSNRLSAFGITGITDATPDLDIGDIVKLDEVHRHGGMRQRLHHLAPGKRILHDDSLNLDELTDWVARRHRDGAPVAVHCVTAAQLVITIAALRATGGHPDDRIEHAAVVPDDCLGDLADLGVTVVTQPNFVAERGDQYLTDVPVDEHHQLWRLASLLDAGVPVALSTDMPFGDGDPWAAMRAAVHRRTPSGAVLGEAERVSARTALELFLGTAAAPTAPRSVAPGQPGDLCVLGVPPAELLNDLDGGAVVATLIEGELTYRR